MMKDMNGNCDLKSKIMNKDFKKFALSRGISSQRLFDFTNNPKSYVNPTVIEERQMNMTSMDIFSRLQMDRILFLNGEINDDTSNIIAAQLLWLEQQGNSDITMQISSPGGSIYAGYKILDTMNHIKVDVATVSMGMVASMATIIATSGTKGKRYILPHARFLIHQPMTGVREGTQASDIEIHCNEILKLKKELNTILSDCSGISFEEIEKMTDRDFIMTAKEAVDNGFLDEVIK